jgi:hypothetical protein
MEGDEMEDRMTDAEKWGSLKKHGEIQKLRKKRQLKKIVADARPDDPKALKALAEENLNLIKTENENFMKAGFGNDNLAVFNWLMDCAVDDAIAKQTFIKENNKEDLDFSFIDQPEEETNAK